MLRLTLIDNYVNQNQQEYIYDEVEPLERDISMELMFAWKPTQLNTFFIGVNGDVENYDTIHGGEAMGLDDVTFFVKYSRSFEF